MYLILIGNLFQVWDADESRVLLLKGWGRVSRGLGLGLS